MTQPTLPVLGGGGIKAEDVQEGRFVKLRGGAVLPVTPDHIDGPGPLYSHIAYDGTGHFLWWKPDGTIGNDAYGIKDDLDIVLVLGQAEETHGDGTVTKVTPMLVRMAESLWDEYTPTATRSATNGETYLHSPKSAVKCVCAGTFHDRVILTPNAKPVPSPTYTEKLIEAVKKGEVVLPRYGDELWWNDNRWEIVMPPHHRPRHEIWPTVLGLLPPRKEGDETSIDLATVREALTKQETT